MADNEFKPALDAVEKMTETLKTSRLGEFFTAEEVKTILVVAAFTVVSDMAGAIGMPQEIALFGIASTAAEVAQEVAEAKGITLP